MPMPAPLFGRQSLIHAHGTAPCRASKGKFHRHDRDTEHNEEEKIDKNERPASVLPDEIRELPDIADTDRTAGTEENEAEAALQRFSRHESNLLKNIMKGTAKTKAVPFIIS